MRKNKKEKIIRILFIFLALAYLFLLAGRFSTSLINVTSDFGSVDQQSNWTTLENFLRMKTPFKDYYFPYGLFFMFLQAPAFITFGKNFLALLISRDLYLPLISIVISCLVAQKILRKKSLIFIFLFLALLFGTNYGLGSVRHLVAELSLSFFILSLLGKEKSGFLSGLIAGLAILTSLEYGIAVNLTIGLLLIIYLFGRAKNNFPGVVGDWWQSLGFFKEFILGETIVLFPFFIWLFLSGSLINYYNFTLGFINNFYYSSPCSCDSFPRLSEITSLRSDSPLLIFGLPIFFLQKLNFYLNIIFLFITGLVSLILFIKEKYFSKRNFLKVGLVIYGLLISIRTLDTPCLPYFDYSLVPSLLLITLLIENLVSSSKQKKPILKILGFSVVLAIFSWLILTENTGYLVKTFGNLRPLPKVSFEKTFYPPVGWWLKSDLVKNYQEITNYIIQNTNKNDYLYVYPWGPYNQLTGRRSPTGADNALDWQITGEKLMNLTQNELEQKKPKLVIINIYNNLGIVHYAKTRGDVGRYYSLGYEDGPVFLGEGNIIEKYILENYEPILKNDLAIVMKQRTKPITIDEKKKKIYVWQLGEEEKIELQSMQKRTGSDNYKITDEKASWTLVFKDPIEASDIAIEFKLDGDLLTKHLTRYFINLYALDENGEKLGEARILARKTWQEESILLNKLKKIKSVKIEIVENTGLIWWLNPYRLAIRGINFYEYTP